MDGKGIKGVVNSILAAVDVTKLSAEDLADIQKKLTKTSTEPAPAAVPTEQPMAEDSIEQPESHLDLSDTYLSRPKAEPHPVLQNFPILKNGFITNIVRRAGLTHLLQDEPANLAFYLCEAIYVYIIEHNSNTEFIHFLAKILRDSQFKASPMLVSSDDLEDEEAVLIYNALLKKEEEIISPKKQHPTPKMQGSFSLNEEQKKNILREINK